MKGLVIENQYQVDMTIRAFLKDNPDMFESVHEETFCENRDLREIAPHIPKADAIIIASTFRWKDQLIEYLDAFLTGPFKDLPMKFYIHRMIQHLNDWKFDKHYGGKECYDKILLMHKAGREIFSFDDDGDEQITDELNIFYQEHPRQNYIIHSLLYSDEHSMFYHEDHKYRSLDWQIKDEKEEQERKGQRGW